MGNKKYLKEFEEYNKNKGLSPATITLQSKVIKVATEQIKKDFNTLTKKDMENYFLFLKKKYAKSSVEQMKITTKKFFKWLHDRNTDEEIEKVREQMIKDGATQLEIDRKEWELRNYRPKYPMCVDWLRAKPVPTNKTEKDVILPEEIYKIISVCDHPQHRAIISLMWDIGLRIGQLCDIKLEDLTINGNKIDITFELDWDEVRTVPTIDSTPALFEWLNQHPYKNDPNKNLFVTLCRHKYGNRYTENGLYGLIVSLGKRAGLKKHVSPHLIRHSRVTYWKRTGVDSATIKFIGLWSMNSQIPDTVYNHMIANDHRNNVITATTGIPTVEKTEVSPTGINYCPRCGEPNSATNQYCVKCREPLTGLAKEKQEQFIREQITNEIKNIIKRNTEPDTRTFEVPIEYQSDKELIETGARPKKIEVVLEQQMPSQEELYKKYLEQQRLIEKLMQQK